MTKWLVDFVIGMAVLEAVVLTVRHARTGRGLAPRQVLPNLAAGLCLTVAVRLALDDAWWLAIAVCLAGSGVAHLVDMRQR